MELKVFEQGKEIRTVNALTDDERAALGREWVDVIHRHAIKATPEVEAWAEKTTAYKRFLKTSEALYITSVQDFEICLQAAMSAMDAGLEALDKYGYCGYQIENGQLPKKLSNTEKAGDPMVFIWGLVRAPRTVGKKYKHELLGYTDMTIATKARSPISKLFGNPSEWFQNEF